MLQMGRTKSRNVYVNVFMKKNNNKNKKKKRTFLCCLILQQWTVYTDSSSNFEILNIANVSNQIIK